MDKKQIGTIIRDRRKHLGVNQKTLSSFSEKLKKDYWLGFDYHRKTIER